jgi:predicted nicotinamide N-methyase
VWPAAILLGQWVAQMAAREGVVAGMRDKVVLELGAGCGLPAIVAGTVEPLWCSQYHCCMDFAQTQR